MYDSSTASLIRLSPPVDGYDPSRLPELLTECYARISTVRLRLSEENNSGLEELSAPISQLRTLAVALEMHAALSPERKRREAAAFVSASAHQLLVQAYRLLPDYTPQAIALKRDGIPSEISAALLFLAAGYPADASEMIGSISDVDRNDSRASLLNGIMDLCAGKLSAAANRRLRIPDDLADEERAELFLWKGILDALTILAVRFIEPPERSPEAMEQFRIELERIRQLSVSELQLPAFLASIRPAFSAFTGPHHLATLLLAAGTGLNGRALTDIPSPSGPPEDSWRTFINSRLSSRPFLWTNHMDAIRNGLLDMGQSATISFPTGAGKSTLSELKVAATVLSKRKVVYLAPTLALVNQVSRNIRNMLSAADVGADEVEDQLFAVPEAPLEKAVSVMTPERCLLLITLYPESFEDIGLVVFDECHSLHMASPKSASNRPVSAMLSLLRLLEISQDADVLLMSAMMKNGQELSEWLSSTFGKSALTFDAAWKPTRQARGSVIFSQGEINQAKSLIPPPGKNIPHSKLGAIPYALICLQQTWQSNDPNNYRMLRLIDSHTRLRGGRLRNGWPTVRLETSACAVSIALTAAERGLKTIVFFHNPSSINPALKVAEEASDVAFAPTDTEQILRQAAILELGGSEFLILPNAIAGGHYGDLLREEREIVEDAFKRADGVRVLFSTNTLAQGMNLPADLVIIVRTGTYDSNLGEYHNIQAYELLNAAGRAGRAGHAAAGMVLVIPDRIVEFNARGQMNDNILHLKNDVLAQDDRCLDISDPIGILLDALTEGKSFNENALNYLLLRLPPRSDGEDSAVLSKHFFSRSFAAYRARSAGFEQEFQHKIEKAISYRSILLGNDLDQTVEALCSATGLPPSMVTSILQRIGVSESLSGYDVSDWAAWLMDLIRAVPEIQTQLLRSTVRNENLIGVDIIADCLKLWLTGQPLKEIELALGTLPERLGHLKLARKFARDTVRELSYVLGLVAQISEGLSNDSQNEIAKSASRAAVLMREGLDTREKWVLFEIMKPDHWTRVRVHREAETWLQFVRDAPGIVETNQEHFQRVQRGIKRYKDRIEEDLR